MYSPSAVAFVLKVTAGTGRGAEHRFNDGQQATLGRTADNDVVVRDSAASRSHARVFEKGGKYFIEDLGSANGTLLNKARIKGTIEMHLGDVIGIGEVTRQFTRATPPAARPDATIDESGLEDRAALNDADKTSAIVSPPELSEPAKPMARRRTVARRPATLDDDPQEPPENQDDDGPAASLPLEDEYDPALDEPPEPEDEQDLSDVPGLASNVTKHVDVPPPRALSRAGVDRAGRLPVRTKSSAAREPVALSAAERARNRRQLQQSAAGRLQLIWDDLPKGGRIALAVVLSAAAAAVAGFLIWVGLSSGPPEKVEPGELQANGQAIADSFGLGEGITFKTRDQKTFAFTTASPTRVVGVLHYQAKSISRDEVALSLNGGDLGTVPPDTVDSDARELDLVLPALQLRSSDEGNTITFDNVNNPPQSDTWKVWNIWVEVNPVPELTAEDAERRAQEDIDRANLLAQRRDIGAENLFTAWKTYREAWLLLEATPKHSVELEKMARTRMRELRPELDRKCNAMFIEVKKALNQKTEDLTRARAVLQDVPRYFPGREHPCLAFSQSYLRDLENLDQMP